MGVRRWVARARAAVRGARLDDDLDAEIQAHLDMAAAEYVRRGLSDAEGRARARRDFGGVEPMKERYRDARGLPLLDALRQDVRYAWRMLRKAPGVSLVAALSLALAIGANTAVFSTINALLLRTLPVRDPHALVTLEARHDADPSIISFPMYRDLRDQNTVLAGLLASAGETPLRLTIPPADGRAGAELDNMRVAFVTGNYFEVLGVEPLAGRFFAPEEDRGPATSETAGSVVVLAHDFWTRQFGADPQVVGRTILVGRSPCRVIGIAPAGFSGEAVGFAPAGWAPVVPFTSNDDLENRRGVFTAYMGRLKPGVTRAQAQAAMTLLFQQLLAAEGRVKSDPRGYTLDLPESATGLDYAIRRTYSRPLVIIMAIVATVLLIACANIANLFLARAAARRGEIGVRLAIGCSRRRLIAQLLTESVLLSILGASAGLLLSIWGSRALVAMVSFGPLPIRLDVTPDARVFAFLLLVTVGTGLAFGLVPALRATRMEATPSLTGAARGDAAHPSRQRLNRALVATQVALSLLLLVSAGLLIRSLQNLHGLDWGFRPEHVLIFDLAHDARNREPAAMAQVASDLSARVALVPGVESASVSGLLLFSPSDIGSPIAIRGYAPAAGERVFARFNAVSAHYFETVGMALAAGRGIEERDTHTSPLVAVVNESFAGRYLPGGAVGHVMQLGAGPNAGKPIEIVGVVRDAKYNNLRETAHPMFYAPIAQMTRSLRSLEVRTEQPVAAIAPLVRQAMASVTRDVMIRRIVTLGDQVDQSLAGERLIMKLSTGFGGLALLLACIGLYGVMSYAVAQRTGEIGIRMALGASGGAVRWMVLRQTLGVVGLGIAIGIPAAIAAARLVARFLFGLSASDPLTILSASGVLVGSAALASYWPARRAARVDPIVALRYE